MKKTLIPFLIVMLNACASNPHRVLDINADVKEKYGTNQGAMIAIDKDGQAVIQRDTDAEVELREQQWRNIDLEKTVETKHESLERCRIELADPRLGGNGNVTETPDLDIVNALPEKKEQFGLTNQGLKVVKKEMFLDRLKAERRYEDVLKNANKMLTKYMNKCDNDMRLARVKSGLPANRYEGVGFFYGGGRYQAQRRAEQSLDDAFQFLAEDKAKAGHTQIVEAKNQGDKE